MQNPSDLYSFDAGPDARPEELMTDSAVLIVALGAIIDAGACPADASTVVDLSSGAPELVRHGLGDPARLGL